MWDGHAVNWDRVNGYERPYLAQSGGNILSEQYDDQILQGSRAADVEQSTRPVDYRVLLLCSIGLIPFRKAFDPQELLVRKLEVGTPG